MTTKPELVSVCDQHFMGFVRYRQKINNKYLRVNTIPWRVARMCKRDVTNAEIVVGAQNPKAVAQRVAAFNAQ